MKKKYALIFLVFLCSFFYGFGQTTIAVQDFEASPATPTMTFTGGSNATGNGAFPNAPKYVSGSQGRQVNNTTQTILFSAVDASSYSSVFFTCRLASFAGTSGNGADGADEVYIDISTDSGSTWSRELEVQGNSNAKWSFTSGTGTASTNYDGDNIQTTITPAGGGNRTTDGYSTITVNNIPSVSGLRVRLVINNNSGNEYWVIDDAEIKGTVAATDPSLSISGTPTNHGSVCVSTPATTVQYTITNNSSSTLTANNVSVTSDDVQFAVSNYTTGNLTVGSSATFDVTFTPTAAGAQSAIITVASTTGSSNSPTINLTGTGMAVVVQDVTTNAASNIGGTTATLNGNVTTLGTCPDTTEKGFVYSVTSTNANPLIGGGGVTSNTVAGISTGTYSFGATGLTIGTDYSYKAYVYDGTTYTYGATQTFTTITPPPNDDCSGAIVLTPTSTCSYTTYSNVNATDSGELPLPGCAQYVGSDVWFSVVVPASGEITIDTNNIDFTDSGIALYSGSCGSLTLIECDDDDSPNGNMSLITRTGLTVGNTVYIRVWEYNGNAFGDFGICVTTPTLCVAPLAQPTGLNLSNPTSSTIDGSFTASATADNYLVIASTSNTLSGNPTDTNSYTVGNALGGGTVVAVGNSTSFTATGLSGTTTYYFFVFAFNDNGCAGGPIYLTANPLTGNETTLVAPCLGEESFESTLTPTGWSQNGVFRGNSTSNARTGSRYAGFNDVGDWLELDAVDNPTSLQYYARLSSNASSSNRIKVQYFDANSNWIDLDEHIANTTAYQVFTTDLTNISILTNVRLRLYRSQDDRTHYIDDLSVYCGSPATAAELQLVDDSGDYQDCGYSIGFGSISTAMTSDVTFEILNLGNQNLTFNPFTITGDFSISPAVVSPLASGASQTYTITFAPQTAGLISETLTINPINDWQSDEAPCIINLSGTGFIGTPEINVEGDIGTFPDISNGDTTPRVLDNTEFANQFIGSSQGKSFRIQNLGTADLTVSSVTIGGANPTDFTVSIVPAGTVTPSNLTTFEITFAPLTAGVDKTADISITNNDSDEDPYIFRVQGTGLCVATSITITPTSGPEGTVVTVTGTNLSSATASFNGLAASVTNISSTEIEVTVPAGATTGNLEVTDDSGCPGFEVFTVVDTQIGGCEGGSSLSDLFISEVTDATVGGMTYIEIYNGTGATVSLNGYSLDVYSNGNSTTSGSVALNNVNLLNDDTYVVAIGIAVTPNSTNTCISVAGSNGQFADQTSGIGGINKKTNEHDVIRLVNSGTTIDEFGVFQDNDWMDSTIITGDRGFNFRRLNTATTLPDPTFTLGELGNWVVIDWVGSGSGSCSTNDYSNIGSYDFSVGSPPTVTLEPVAPFSSCDLSATLIVAGTEGFVGGNTLEYQWLVSAPGAPGWTDVTNGAIYSGATTATLNILNTFNLDNYQYYCQIREDDATCYSASDAVRLSVPKTEWDGTSWSNGIPDINTIATINANYDTSIGGVQDSFSACQLIVNAAFTLTIADNTFVEVINDVTVDGSITVATEGAFVQRGDGVAAGIYTNNGISTVQKTTATFDSSISTYNYTYWSSPIANANVATVFPNPFANRRFYYQAENYLDATAEAGNNNATEAGQDDIDDDGNDWQNASGVMDIGRGYAVTAVPGPPMPGLYSDTADFIGEFNTGDVLVSVYKNDFEPADNNWNFIGNPYPSAIDIDKFFIENLYDVSTNPTGKIDGAIFLWSQGTAANAGANGNEGFNFSQTDYAVINGMMGTAGGNGIDPNPYIPSGQGFFVSYDHAAGEIDATGQIKRNEVKFTNSMRETGNNDQFFRTATIGFDNKLWLNLTSDNGIFSQIGLGYVSGATNGYDGMYYDAPRNLSTGAYSILYSIIEGSDDKYAIQGKEPNSLNLDEVIPLGFYTSIDEATLYTFSIAQFEGDFFESNTVYVKDILMNIVHNLSGSDYTFTSEVGEFNQRFEIVFNSEALSVGDNELDPKDLRIVELNSGDVEFTIGNNFQIKSIEIIDLLGRTIYRLRGNSNREVYNLSNLSSGTYIAKVELSNGQIITKKAIKRK